MPTSFPLNLVPSAIDDRQPGIVPTSRFETANGQGTTTTYGSAPSNAQMTLRFGAMRPLEEALLMEWWYAIGGGSEVSARSFLINDCHPMWSLLKTWPIWRANLDVDALGRHWWVASGRLSIGGELCFLTESEITIKNIARRA